jgi:hypothetical protein
MDVEAKAQEMAERIGWPDKYAAHIRHAGIDDMKRALIAFSAEQNKSLRDKLAAVADMIENCADVPRNPDSLPMMILRELRATDQQPS